MAYLFFTLQSLFSLWMLVDCVRRGRPNYWIFIIMVPFGEWAYFFNFKIHDPELRWLKDLFRGGGGALVAGGRGAARVGDVDKLRFDYDDTPSQANRLALATALHDHRRYAEAAELFEQALRADDTSRDALLGLGLSRQGLGELPQAEAALRRLTTLSPSFRDWMAWDSLAQVVHDQGRPDDGVEVLRALVVKAPWMLHHLHLARMLRALGRPDEAREVLERALAEHEHAPDFRRRQDRARAGEALKMLDELR